VLFAAIDIAASLSVVIGVIGIAGLIFTALSFGRSDTTQVVTQQAQITQEMKTLNDEQRQRAELLLRERDDCRMESQRLHGQIEELRAMTTGKMTRIERKDA
jgi:hypothetical protein